MKNVLSLELPSESRIVMLFHPGRQFYILHTVYLEATPAVFLQSGKNKVLGFLSNV